MGDVYIVQPSELTAVADAIREKGETSAPLVFPSGFVSAIQDISSGGLERNFEVVGGTTQPTNPKENTIWVNTSTAITGWSFSATEPTSPISGMIWILVSTSGPAEFNALKENEIQIYPVAVKQYIGGVWKDATGFMYQNENWLSFKRYLFKSGEGALVVFNTYKEQYATVTVGTDAISITSTKTATNIGSLRTADRINLTGYSIACIKATVTKMLYDDFNAFGITNTAFTAPPLESAFAAKADMAVIGSEQIYQVPLNDENMYVGLVFGGTVTITDIWLE